MKLAFVSKFANLRKNLPAINIFLNKKLIAIELLYYFTFSSPNMWNHRGRVMMQ